MFERKRVRIGQFLKERDGRYDPNDKSVLGLKRLNKIDFSGEIHLSDKGSKTDMIVVEPGDFVISGINVSKGALAVYHGEKPITATIHYSSYVFDEKQIDIEYFKRFVRSQSFIQALKDQVKGGIKTEIKPKHFLPLEIDLPDIEIQKEIVSFFKRVEGGMDELGSEISSQIEYLNKFRQAVLQEAIEGKLTAEWRKQNPALISGENHASKLLEKIKAEKERLIKEGKLKKEKPLSPIADEEKPFELPVGWVWTRLVDLVSLLGDGLHGTPNYSNNGEYFFINGNNLNEGEILIKGNTKRISLEEYNKHKKDLTEKTVLVSINGTLGNVAFYNNEKIVLGKSACYFNLLDGISKHYIKQIIKTKYFLIYASDKASETTIKNLSLKGMRMFLVPLPPLAEQQAFIERVEKLMAIIDDLEKQVTERKGQSEMLMQSVLREAFAG